MNMAMSRFREESEEEDMPRKKKKVDWFLLLADDIVLEILKKLPSSVLCYREVKWTSPSTSYCRAGSKTKLEFEQTYLEIPCRGRIKSWCNEFLLMVDPIRSESLYVYDLFTQKGLNLPQCSLSCGGHYTSKCCISLCYDGIQRLYKVIHVFMGPPIRCQILVLLSDIVSSISNFSKWKRIEVPINMGEGQYYWGDPVSVQGRYLHWDVHCSDYLVSMDTVQERFYETRLPGSNDERMRNQYSFVEMNGFLALLDKVSGNKANLWILKDFHKMKWEKLHSLNLSCHWYLSIYPHTDIPFPISSVVNKRHIIFKKPTRPKTVNGLLRYDLETNAVESVRCTMSTGYNDRYVVHSVAPGLLW